ncbi:CopY/TcrY family copper transport repressor [Streptococcus moroccensis]|uniref:CopY/TcrY family copper transport repressor n=1 Tax=Streptococcus moroccensis TaxID=1451356 RepID=A0ABT9YUU3_9STRE|nr:CopY/TcrY family copper transport repressor [Streptococcus moroccensis]MDQ0222875.1 CopY/TcrY family copper transport repressor [Streptococcus moroccensis]
MERESMSQAEWQVMRVLWANPGATSAQVIAHLSKAYNWQAATIKTLLGRLKTKGLVRTEQVGKKFAYYAQVSEADHLTQSLETIQSSICNTKHVDLVSLLLSQGEFSQADLERISQEALAQKTTAPATLACNCLAGQCTCGQHGGHCHD